MRGLLITAPAAPPLAGNGLSLQGSYELDPAVGLRDERFGALAYHYGNRRLTFLNDRKLVDLVRSLSSYDDLDSALRAQPIADNQRPAFVIALGRLAEAGVIRDRNA